MSWTSKWTMSQAIGWSQTSQDLAAEPAGGVFDDGEGLREDLVEAVVLELRVFDRGDLFLPALGHFAQLLVGEGFILLVELVDLADNRLASA